MLGGPSKLPTTDAGFVRQLHFTGLQQQQNMVPSQQDNAGQYYEPRASGNNYDGVHQQYAPQQGPPMRITAHGGTSQLQCFYFEAMASCCICKIMFEPDSIVCRLPECCCHRTYHTACLDERWPQRNLSCHACNGPEDSKTSADVYTYDTTTVTEEVASTLRGVVAKYKRKARNAQAYLLEAIQLRNEAYEEKEALMVEKEDWEREKAALIREKKDLQRQMNMRAMFAQTACSTLQDRIREEVEDKKMLCMVILFMFGVMVDMLFGVLKKQMKQLGD